MSWGKIALGVGVAAAVIVWKIIYDVIDEEERDARENWEEKRQEVCRSIEEHRMNIELHLENAQSSYDFHFLVNLHYSSVNVANQAYSLLQDARSSLSGLGKMLKRAKEEKIQLQKELDAAKREFDKGRFTDLLERIKLVNEIRRALFDDLDKVQTQKDIFLAKVRELNNRTHSLKEAIKDRCGNKGESWYYRLELRKSQRNLSFT